MQLLKLAVLTLFVVVQLTPCIENSRAASQVFTVWPNPPLLCTIKITSFRLKEKW